jgi:DNA-binding response OmpR family regulator
MKTQNSILTPSPSSSPYRILVIEDDAEVARPLLRHLEQAGLECYYAANSRAGLVALQEHAPHLVLLGVMLPDLNGYALCTCIRRQSMVPIILLSPQADVEDALRGFKVGADDYVVKPFNPKLLIARVVAHLRRVYRYDVLHYSPRHLAQKPQPNPVSTTEAVSTARPLGWIECESCRYLGPEKKFEQHQSTGQITMKCPHCHAGASIAFALS